MKTANAVLLLGCGLLTAGIALLGHFSHAGEEKTGDVPSETTVVGTAVLAADRVETFEIAPKATYGALMESAGVSQEELSAIYAAAKDVYDLAAIRAGKTLELHYDSATSTLKELVYPISTEEELHVRKEGAEWKAEKTAIDYEVRLKTVKGTVASSLYAAGLEQGVDERAIVELGDVFQWTIDFAQDVRVGDTYTMVYEERYRDGQYVMPGAILAANYVNAGTPHQAFHYVNASGDEGYYDQQGGSLRKMFLKAPLAFKYITSGFTTGLRYVSAFNTSTGHRAIDYAAALGTPIRATADGVVTFAGWDGPYGNKTSIRHNGTYSTNYAHQSRFAVKKGQHVTQGQVIGYVGSTGFSTGPHLHYEMVKNGTKINPLRETFPGTDPIKAEEKEAFAKVVAEWQSKL